MLHVPPPHPAEESRTGLIQGHHRGDGGQRGMQDRLEAEAKARAREILAARDARQRSSVWRGTGTSGLIKEWVVSRLWWST